MNFYQKFWSGLVNHPKNEVLQPSTHFFLANSPSFFSRRQPKFWRPTVNQGPYLEIYFPSILLGFSQDNSPHTCMLSFLPVAIFETFCKNHEELKYTGISNFPSGSLPWNFVAWQGGSHHPVSKVRRKNFNYQDWS